MPYEKAVQYSHHVLDLCSKSKENVKELFDEGNNDEDADGVESIRVRTDCYELIVAQEGNYILVVIYVGATIKNCNNENHNGLKEGSKETAQRNKQTIKMYTKSFILKIDPKLIVNI